LNYLSKENVQEILELTPLQEALLRDSADATSEPLLEQVRYTLAGFVVPDRFQQAWDRVCEAPPALRTLFRSAKNRVVQVVLRTRPVPVDVRDLRGLTEAGRQQALLELEQAHREPFRTSEGPLVRLGLALLSEESAALVWTWHPAIMDDWSRSLLMTDLLEIYSGLHERQPLPGTRRPSARAYLDWYTAQDWKPARAFWADQLAEFDGPTPLLWGEHLQGGEPPGAALKQITLNPEHSQALMALARKFAVSPAVLAEAAWAMLLSVYSSEEYVCFGLRSPGRPAGLPDSADLIGPFANTLPVRMQVAGEQRVADFLRTLEQQRCNADTYAYSTLSQVLTDSGLSAHDTVFRSVLTVAREAALLPAGVPWRVAAEERLTGVSAPFEVTIRPGEAWQICCRWLPGVCDELTAERLLEHFQMALVNMATLDNPRVRDVEILGGAERYMVLEEFNRPEPSEPLDRLMVQRFEQQVERTPDAVAVRFGTEQMTYRQLNGRANRLAHWLRREGVGREDIVGILAERSIEMLAAILAVFKAGAAYVPLDAAYPDQRLLTLLGECRAKAILTQNPLLQRTLSLAAAQTPAPRVFCLDRAAQVAGVPDLSELEQYAAENPPLVGGPDDLAYIFFTSGSTGTPKGAMIEQVGMLNHLLAKINLFELAESAVVAQNASHAFDISVWQFLAALLVGGQVVIYSDEIAGDPAALFQAIRRDGVTVLEVVPTVLDLLIQVAGQLSAEERTLPALRYMFSNAEAMPVAMCRKWLQIYPGIPVVESYGATECADDTTHEFNRIPPAEGQTFLTVGRTIPNFRTYVLDRWLRPVPVGAVGEIYFTGIGVGRGYLNNPARTSEAFLTNSFADDMGPRMYRTGDLGRFLPDGRLVIHGRRDFQVKVRGRRIELGEIDAALHRHPAVQRAVTIVRPDAQGQNRLLAYVVAAEPIVPSALRKFLQSVLPEGMLPEHIMQLPQLPLTRNGKVDRKALPDPPESQRPETEWVAPDGPIEMALAAIWQQVLGVSRVGVNDNFFLLGGHSLKTIQVRARIREQMGVELPLRALFDQQTIRQLAHTVVGLNPTITAAGPTIPRQPESEYMPLSYAQRRLWFLHQLNPRGTAYNMTAAFDLGGPLDLTILQRTFQRIVDRHATLRTTFVLDGEPRQRIAPQLALGACPLTDLAHLGAEVQRRAIAALIEQETTLGFDLSTGPLLRLQVAKLGEQLHAVVISMHHIASDHWSWNILARELVTLYEAYSQGFPDPMAPLPIQYADYAHWQSQRLAAGKLQEDEAFWLDSLSGPLPVLDLPLDFSRPPVLTTNGRIVTSRLDADLAARLKERGRQAEVTTFILLLAATGGFLSQLTGQQEILIGSPVSGRTTMELEELIGFFINNLVYRLDLSDSPTFAELLRNVRDVALTAFAHQEYPFDLLVERLNPPRDPSRTPIFSVQFQVLQEEMPLRAGPLKVRPRSVPVTDTKYDLAVLFSENADGLDCNLTYNADLFAPETIERWMESLKLFLGAVAENPDMPLATSRSDTDRGRLPAHDGTTRNIGQSEPTRVHELFQMTATRLSGAVAAVCGQRSWTYAELNRRATKLAHRLRKLGVGPRVPVGLWAPQGLEALVGLLGILKAGGAYLPIDPILPSERVTDMLDAVAAPVLLTQAGLLTDRPALRRTAIALDRDWEEIDQEPETRLALSVQATDPVCLLYAAGSGRQPGVTITHGSLLDYFHQVQQALHLPPGSSYATASASVVDPANTMIFQALCSGGRLYIPTREDAPESARLAGYFRRNPVDCLAIPLIDLTAMLMRSDPSTVLPRRRLVLGGEALRWDLAERIRWLAPDCEIFNHAGPTETTAGLLTCRVGARAAGDTPIPPTPAVPTARTGPAPPRTPMEAEMVRIWEQVLDVRPVGVTENFFAIGGHSLKAVTLIRSVQERLGVDLPLAAIFLHQTVAELCQDLGANAAGRSSCLLRLQAGNGDRPPFFLVHPSGGTALCYVPLVQELGPNLTVYGLQAIGFAADEPPLVSVSAMADRYLSEIQGVASAGPYYLAGWSFGGTVAFEIARRLEAQGETVMFLGLLDTHPRGLEAEGTPADARDLRATVAELAVELLGATAAEFEGLAEAQVVNAFLEQAKLAGLLPPGATADDVFRLVRVIESNSIAGQLYRHEGPVQTDIHLIRASDRAAHAGAYSLLDGEAWTPHTTGRVHVIDVPGNHYDLLRAPNIAVLARELVAVLDRQFAQQVKEVSMP
jgi:amino acid adenylation domain-containing protein